MVVLSIVVSGALHPGGSAAQPLPLPRPPTQVAGPVIDLSLEEAIRRAVRDSEEVQLAQASVDEADTRIAAARAARLPQLNATTAYVRTLQSPIGRGLNLQFPEGDRFNPDPTAPLEQRVTYLEQNASNAVLTTLSDLLGTALQNVGLGSPHTYSANLEGSQLLFSGGRVGAGVTIARRARDAARFTFQEEAADVELNARTAYLRALLSQELEAIAQAAVVQAESFLNQEQLRLKAGFASDLDVLRAEVSLENLRPQLVESRNTLELALLDLKRLINVPLSQPVRLTTPLEVPTTPETEMPITPEALVEQRPAVQAADQQVAAQAAGVQLARSAYMPTVALQVATGGQIFPRTVFGFSGTPWQPNSAATVAVQVPLFDAQRGADVGQARVQLRQAELRAVQLRESVQLQYEQALGERERARATIAARQRTVDQAQRVYDLTVLRYGQGLATQLEVSDSRLALLQARTNLAQALSDFYIAGAAVRRARGVTTVPPATPPLESRP
jgi:outer membrane protein TolC